MANRFFQAQNRRCFKVANLVVLITDVAGILSPYAALACDSDEQSPLTHPQFIMEPYYEQQFGTSLDKALGIGNTSQQGAFDEKLAEKSSEGSSGSTASIQPVIFNSAYHQGGKLSQSTALGILKIDKYGNPLDPKIIPGYQLNEIQEDFSYAECLSHYALHSTLFEQGVLPVSLFSLENVSIMTEKKQTVYDAHLEVKKAPATHVRRVGNIKNIMEETYHHYERLVQPDPQHYTTLEQLVAGEGASKITPESLSTLVISHLLTGSKAPLKDYRVLADGQLVLPASVDGVYPVIAQVVGGQQDLQHVSHLTSGLFLIPEVMGQRLAQPVADKVTAQMPEIIVLYWTGSPGCRRSIDLFRNSNFR